MTGAASCVPLSDLAHLLPALAREAVTVEWEGNQRGALLFANPEDGYCVAATTYAHARGPASGFLLVCDPTTVRALAVVIAEAVGMDASGGATAWWSPSGHGVRVQTEEHIRVFTIGSDYEDHSVPALATATDLPSALVAVARGLAGVTR